MKFKLFFGAIEIGEVIEVETDMFYYNGKVSFADAFKVSSDPLVKKIQKYIDYSIRINTRKEQEPLGADNFDHIRQEGKQYIDLLETDDWHFIWERKRQKNYVLRPEFGSNDRISMRLNTPVDAKYNKY
jgi:hypothetical protein